MKLNRTGILNALESAARACQSGTRAEILKHAKIVYDGTALSVTATDGEVGSRITIPGGIEGDPLTVAIPATQACRVLKELADDWIEIDWKGDAHATFSGEHDSFSINAWRDPAEFPEWTHEGSEYIVSPVDLRRAIGRCGYAAEKGNGSIILSGVNLLISGGFLTIQATDTRRCAFEPIACIGEPVSALIPVKAANMAAALAGDVALSVGQNSVEFRTPCETVYGRQIAGKFPTIKKASFYSDPNDPPVISVVVGDLARLIRKAALAADAKDDTGGRIDIELAGGSLRATAASSANGAADVRLAVDSDRSCKATFWSEYFRETLAALDQSKTITWEMAAGHGNIFRMDDWTGILMPIFE